MDSGAGSGVGLGMVPGGFRDGLRWFWRFWHRFWDGRSFLEVLVWVPVQMVLEILVQVSGVYRNLAVVVF